MGNEVGYCFAVRLVVITDDRMRSHAGATQSATEAGFRPGTVPLVRQEKIDALSALINGMRQITLLATAKAGDLIPVLSPPNPSPVTVECLSQWRPEDLHPSKHGACRDLDSAFS
jgi:hypothetical protein